MSLQINRTVILFVRRK